MRAGQLEILVLGDAVGDHERAAELAEGRPVLRIGVQFGEARLLDAGEQPADVQADDGALGDGQVHLAAQRLDDLPLGDCPAPASERAIVPRPSSQANSRASLSSGSAETPSRVRLVVVAAVCARAVEREHAARAAGVELHVLQRHLRHAILERQGEPAAAGRDVLVDEPIDGQGEVRVGKPERRQVDDVVAPALAPTAWWSRAPAGSCRARCPCLAADRRSGRQPRRRPARTSAAAPADARSRARTAAAGR